MALNDARPSLARRRRSPYAVAACWCAIAWAFTVDASAQRSPRHRPHEAHSSAERPPGSDERRAQALFEEGVGFADQQRWAEAHDAFQRSLAITPRPSTRFNLAQALLRMGRYRAAVAALEAHLNAAEPDDNAPRVAQSRTLLAEARARLVTVALSNIPAGAEVLVDGAAEAGEGPTRVLLLDPGLRRFEVRTSDGRSERFELTLASGTPATHALSPALAATAVVTVTAPTLTHAEAQAAFEQGRQALVARRYDQAAAAFHDAARLEPTPGTWRWLGVTLRSIGRYTEAIAALERYLATPEPGVAPARLEEVGRAVGEMRRSLAQLTVTLQPPSAALQVDGRTRPLEPGAMTLDPGAHVVEIRAEGFEPMRQEVELAAAGQLVLNLRLVALGGRLIVEPSVNNALVVIDAREVGRGRVEQATTPGEHVVEVRAEGYEPRRRVVRVTSAGVTREDVSLVRRGTPGWVLPVAIAGGVLVAGGVAAAVALALQPEDVPINTNWGHIP